MLDPLLSRFGQSGGRHFKLHLDEVRVVITWLRSSSPVYLNVCVYDLDFSSFFSLLLRISAKNRTFVFLLRHTQTSHGFRISRQSRISLSQTLRPGKNTLTVLLRQLEHLPFQLFVNEFCSRREGFPPGILAFVSRPRAGAVRCAEKSLLSVRRVRLVLCFPPRAKHSHRYRCSTFPFCLDCDVLAVSLFFS